MGGLRSSAQLISYELAMGASVIGVVMLAGTLDLNGIIYAQINSPFRWFIIPQFIAFIVFLIAAFAETNRVPFDLPEAETELVAGFSHRILGSQIRAVFYGGIREYVYRVGDGHGFVFGRLVYSGFIIHFEVGSIPYALFSHIGFIGKICAFLFFYIWIRGTLPRFRFDQLMNFGWKFLLPLALANVIFTILIVYFLNR
jgi:NADH-quinone oxidoreductase subunit H